jgi:hypothetical protein
LIRIEGWPKIRTFVMLAYSVAVMATILPGFGRVSNALILPYFVLIPGYAFSSVLRQTEGTVQTLFYSLVWSVAILVSIFSLATIAPSLSTIPLSAVIPVMTMILAVYSYYHRK